MMHRITLHLLDAPVHVSRFMSERAALNKRPAEKELASLLRLLPERCDLTHDPLRRGSFSHNHLSIPAMTGINWKLHFPSDSFSNDRSQDE
jgi:hypothetical protein